MTLPLFRLYQCTSRESIATLIDLTHQTYQEIIDIYVYSLPSNWSVKPSKARM